MGLISSKDMDFSIGLVGYVAIVFVAQIDSMFKWLFISVDYVL